MVGIARWRWEAVGWEAVGWEAVDWEVVGELPIAAPALPLVGVWG